MTVSAKQIDRYRQGYDAFFAGVGLYAIDDRLYQLGWLDAYELAWQAYERERTVKS